MGQIFRFLTARARRYRTDEDGASTIPFIIMAPFFIILTLSSIELGMLMMRHVMLERGLDMSVRELRLGLWIPASDDGMTDEQRAILHQTLRERICKNAAMIPDCDKVLSVELRPVSKDTWAPLAGGATCVDRSADALPVTEFKVGTSNDIMLIRACAIFTPVFPTAGLGASLRVADPNDKDDWAYALVSTTAFVNEPRPGT
ncbi:pilus assembly protein [Frigidibacter sp. SD6-1]|uniref:TadE/TadG family type IV pilus assembly protein n=1 Tax=Frigidibacter sp. SD6-1 TaxID=3032581 RepID=UPI0024DFF8AE|nr:pilus assembly protein [Frigidibacter sp. SD6-1]